MKCYLEEFQFKTQSNSQIKIKIKWKQLLKITTTYLEKYKVNKNALKK